MDIDEYLKQIQRQNKIEVSFQCSDSDISFSKLKFDNYVGKPKSYLDDYELGVITDVII